MNTFSELKEKSRTISRIGFWSSFFTAILNLWYVIAFGLYQPVLHAPWNGMDSYVKTFDQIPYMAWVIPCFLLPLAFITMIISIHALAKEEIKTWSLLALVFAALYTGILCTNYYIQMTVVRHNLAHNMTEGISLWLYANYYPYSIPGAMEGIGYFFMCLSFLCISGIFRQGKLERWIRWIFIATGITGMIVFTDPLYKLPLVFVLIDAGIAGILLTIGPLLLAILFAKNLTAARRGENVPSASQ